MDEKVVLIDTLHIRSQMTCQEITHSGRHHLGHEKISRSSFKATIPSFITEDVSLIAFRFNGKAPMVGYRDGATFHVIWINRSFNLYDHQKMTLSLYM